MIQSNFWRDTGLGQLFMIGLPGTDLDKETLSFITDFGISRFILFSRNASRGPTRFKRLCNDLKNACMDEGLCPILAIDQEGGPVRRLKPPDFPDMPSQTEVRKSLEPERAMRDLAEATVQILKEYSIDLNLAPVLDLCLKAEESVLDSRCFGSDPEKVSRLGAIYIKQLRKNKIMTCAKHFPGIGRVELDPHHHLPVVSAKKEKILREMSPFFEAVSTGSDCVMTSHVIFTALDPEDPATFSTYIATDLLRNGLGFEGALLTDDLEMKGALKKMKIGQAALSALKAGHDLILVCSSTQKVKECLSFVEKGFKEGSLSQNRIFEAQERVSRLTSTFNKNPQRP